MAQLSKVQYVQYYTDGSAARKLAPKTPFKTGKLPQVKRQKRLTVYVDPVAVAGIAVALVMLVLMIVGVAQLRSAQQQTAAMTKYIETLEQENQLLQNTYESGYELEEIERLALALGMVPEDQVQHITLQPPVVHLQDASDDVWQFWAFLTGLFA